MMKSLEQHHFKLTLATAAAVIVFLISMTYSFSSWKSTVEADIDKIMTGVNHVGAVHTELDARVITLEQQDTLFKIQMATIELRLSNIEALLVELKEGQRILMDRT